MLITWLYTHLTLRNTINYQSINATAIPYENYFDIVTFKSILGGISRNKNGYLKQQTIDEIHKSLKSNGVLLFAENIESSFLHKLLRKKFVNWGNDWNYLGISEVEILFSSFKSIDYITVGFFGAFGRSEKQRHLLGILDSVVEKFIPKRMRYILIGIATK